MRDRRLLAGLALALATAILLVALRLVAPAGAVVSGWLVAFSVWSSVPLGSLILLMIHRLTGGEWGRVAGPVLRPAAALMPLVALAFLPVLFGLKAAYPWAADPATVAPDVARLYLNAPAFTLRTVVALCGWSALGVVFALGIAGRLVAGIGLAFHGLAISLIAVDWYLSVEPGYTASAFAATVAIQQLLAALALTAVIGTPALGGKVAGDIGGLTIATLSGVVYLELMTFVIAWYGDLPDKASWYLKRGTPAWLALLLVALLAGAVLPFFMLLVQSVRRSPRGLRLAGGAVLLGTVLHLAWLIAPAAAQPLPALAVAAVGLALLVAASLLLGSAVASRLGEARLAR